MSDDLETRRTLKPEAVAKAAPVTLDADTFAKALVAAQRVAERPRAESLPAFVRCKVRIKGEDGGVKYKHTVRDSQGFPAFGEDGRPVVEWRDVTMTFGADELKEPKEAGRGFRFGETVYLTRDAYLLHAGAGNVVNGQ